MEKSVGLCEISFPSNAAEGKCFDIAFSKSLTDVASGVPSGILSVVFAASLSTGETAAPGFEDDFLLVSSSLSLFSSSQSVVCFRFFSLLAGIGDVLSVLLCCRGIGWLSLSLVRCVTSELDTGALDADSLLVDASVLSVGCLGGGGGAPGVSESGGPFSGSPVASSRLTPWTLSSSWQQSITVLGNSRPL